MLENSLLLGLLIILSVIGGAEKHSYESAILTAMEQQRRDFYLMREQNQLYLEKALAFARETPAIRAKRQSNCARLGTLLKQRTTVKKNNSSS